MDRVDWIKIDVEGAEVSVLKGGMKLLKKHRPKLIVECSHGPSFFEVGSILEPLGYSINEILGLPLYIYAEPR